MNKNRNKSVMNNKDLALSDKVITEFEIFKSRVANAVLHYMEAQSDADLVECLEKANSFLVNISSQMEKVFNNEKEISEDENDMFEISDDLFSTIQQTSSSTIH